MKTFISIVFMSLFLLAGCGKQASKDAPGNQTAVATPPPAPWSILKEHIGGYIDDSLFFAQPEVTEGLKAVLGPDYANLRSDWNVVSPMNMSNNIITITGCKHDACDKSMWMLFMNTTNNIINVYHLTPKILYIYEGKELMGLPKSMNESLDQHKRNFHIEKTEVKKI